MVITAITAPKDPTGPTRRPSRFRGTARTAISRTALEAPSRRDPSGPSRCGGRCTIVSARYAKMRLQRAESAATMKNAASLMRTQGRITYEIVAFPLGIWRASVVVGVHLRDQARIRAADGRV